MGRLLMRLPAGDVGDSAVNIRLKREKRGVTFSIRKSMEAMPR